MSVPVQTTIGRDEVLALLRPLTANQQREWMLELGYLLTVCARDGYPYQQRPGNLQHVMGCNELQHHIHGRVRALASADPWPLEVFFDVLEQTAVRYGLKDELDRTIGSALRRLEA